MPTYSVRAGFGEGGRLIGIYSFQMPTDSEAEAFVRQRLTDETVELWSRSRRVARFEGKAA